MALKHLLLFTLSIYSTSAVLDCCPGSILAKKSCLNGKAPVKLACQHRYILDPSLDRYENFTIKGETLVYESSIILPNQFCVTKLDGKESQIALVCFPEELETTEYNGVRIVCTSISIIFLILTILIYYALPKIRDLQGKCVVNSATGLLISFICLVILQFNGFSDRFCSTAAYIMYLSFLEAFFWLNVLSFTIWKSVVKPNMWGTEKQWYRIYMVWGYGMPLLLIAITIIASIVEGDHLKPGIGQTSCWFAGKSEVWAYFYGPVAILMTLNLIFFIWTSVHLRKGLTGSSPHKLKILRYKFWLYLKLFIVMGLTWIFELLSSAFDNAGVALDYIWMITDFINALQGVIIFVILIVLRKKVLRGLAEANFCYLPYPNSWKNLEHEETEEPIDEENPISKNTNGNA